MVAICNLLCWLPQKDKGEAGRENFKPAKRTPSCPWELAEKSWAPSAGWRNDACILKIWASFLHLLKTFLSMCGGELNSFCRAKTELQFYISVAVPHQRCFFPPTQGSWTSSAGSSFREALKTRGSQNSSRKHRSSTVRLEMLGASGEWGNTCHRLRQGWKSYLDFSREDF